MHNSVRTGLNEFLSADCGLASGVAPDSSLCQQRLKFSLHTSDVIGVCLQILEGIANSLF